MINGFLMDCEWIGFRQNLQEKPMIFMGKSMVSCKFSLKPIQSDKWEKLPWEKRGI